MEYNYHGINQLYPRQIPPPSSYDSFPDRFRRVEPEEIGHIQHDFYRDHHHQLPVPPPFRPHDRREAIEIEIEKERIREETIMHEIRRMLRLEDKARREPIIERESAPRRGGDSFNPYFSSPKMEFQSPTGLPPAHGRSLEEKIVISWKEKIRLYGGLQSEPLNANRGESLSGLKRKAAGVVATELPPNHILKKKVQKMF